MLWGEAMIHVCARGILLDQDHLLLAYDPRPNPYHYYALGESFFYLPGGARPVSRVGFIGAHTRNAGRNRARGDNRSLLWDA